MTIQEYKEKQKELKAEYTKKEQALDIEFANANNPYKVGDIVTKINGEVVEDSTELIVAIRRNNPGDTIVLIVKNSAGNEREVSVVLGSREEG